jgi:guanylate kinase
MTTVFIISAPSGSGKSTLVDRLLAGDKELMFSVSYTTRRPRGKEVDGANYHFVSREDFERMLANGEFLEHAEVFGNYYGTHRSILEKARAAGKDLVLDIDVQGARQLKDQIPEAVTVFILAPSRQILEQRLRARGEDRDEVIERRLREAAEEIRRYNAYDYVLINRDLCESDKVLSAIVCAERVRRTRIEDRIRPILETFSEKVKD